MGSYAVIVGVGSVQPLSVGSATVTPNGTPGTPQMVNLAKKQPQTLIWTITAQDPNNPANMIPVDTCDSVVATLYAGRDIANPDLTPGVPVPELEGVTLTHTSNGQYVFAMPGAMPESSPPIVGFNPPASTNYVLVVDATMPQGSPPVALTPFGHWEEPTTVYINS